MNGEQWPDGVDQEDVYDIIDGVTYSLVKRYRDWVSHDDVRQELRLRAWVKREKFAEYLVRDDAGLRRAGQAAFMKAMMRHGETHCRKEKAKLSGYEPADEFFYTPALIEQLIAAQVQGLSALAGQVGERSTTDAAEGGNAQAMMIDVNHALTQLQKDQKELLFDLYGRGITAKQIALYDGVTEQAVRGRADRALARMVQLLGGERPN